MPRADELLGTYLHLARASALRRRPMVRDKLLVLAGVTAAEMGLGDIAGICRNKVLSHNSRHLMRRWPSLDDALQDDCFQSYLKQLRRRYTPEKAEHMLSSLGIELARERQLYMSDHEYAAALLETTPDAAAALTENDRESILQATRRPEPAGRPDGPLSRQWLWEWGPFAAGVAALAVLGIRAIFYR